MRRERHTISFYAEFSIWPHHVRPPNSTLNSPNQRTAPVAHKVVWPRPGLKLNLLFSSNPKNPQRFRTWRHSRPWSYFVSGVFIVTSLSFTSAPHEREHLHSTNPCTKRKVLSLTKPIGKIYKTKNDNIKKIPPQLYYTITNWNVSVTAMLETNKNICWIAIFMLAIYVQPFWVQTND